MDFALISQHPNTMSDIVIKVENLSKKYVLSHQRQERYTALRDVMANKAKRLGRRVLSPFFSSQLSALSSSREDFFALKDVSFEINRGDRVGIIGRNGAGKSTLLKILSRITEPTSGRIEITGRVASLLEVGTGFHPELTGRENIFLNGAILGMTRVEIKRKFDEIVAFAEIEKFLDTPVKRYSSGMYVRLAFAVAAHLEPEILIVDEVLAVGDVQFQKKCLGKMKKVGDEGRTVLFVSHNMTAIQSLCSRCIILQTGQIQADDQSSRAVKIYMGDSSVSDTFVRPLSNFTKPCFKSGRMTIDHEKPGSAALVEVDILSRIPYSVSLDLRLTDNTGSPVGFGSLGTFDPDQLIQLTEGTNTVSFEIPLSPLAVGSYFISLDLTRPFAEYYDRVENCFSFEVVRSVEEHQKVFLQTWGYGSLEIPLNVKDRHSNAAN
jgi:lipopolysaccharide transport system ATP-binding protein